MNYTRAITIYDRVADRWPSMTEIADTIDAFALAGLVGR